MCYPPDHGTCRLAAMLDEVFPCDHGIYELITGIVAFRETSHEAPQPYLDTGDLCAVEISHPSGRLLGFLARQWSRSPAELWFPQFAAPSVHSPGRKTSGVKRHRRRGILAIRSERNPVAHQLPDPVRIDGEAGIGI